MCKLNKETFFSSFIVEKNDGGYRIISKAHADGTNTDDIQKKSQVYTSRPAVRDFIENHCSDTMTLLPSEFSAFSNEPGIVKGEELYELILKTVDDVDSVRDELVDIMKYDSKKDFILKLSDIEIDLDKEICQEDCEYKLIDAACSSLEKKDYDSFRSKVVIKKDGVSYTYDQLPSAIINEVKVDGAKALFNIDRDIRIKEGYGQAEGLMHIKPLGELGGASILEKPAVTCMDIRAAINSEKEEVEFFKIFD